MKFCVCRGGLQGAGAQEMAHMEAAEFKHRDANGHEPAIVPTRI